MAESYIIVRDDFKKEFLMKISKYEDNGYELLPESFNIEKTFYNEGSCSYSYDYFVMMRKKKSK